MNHSERRQLFQMIRVFLNRRPGFDYANYHNARDYAAGIRMYRAEVRQATTQRAAALAMLDMIAETARANENMQAVIEQYTNPNRMDSFRLHITAGEIHYTAGQYEPIERRHHMAQWLAAIIHDCTAMQYPDMTNREIYAYCANRFTRKSQRPARRYFKF